MVTEYIRKKPDICCPNSTNYCKYEMLQLAKRASSHVVYIAMRCVKGQWSTRYIRFGSNNFLKNIVFVENLLVLMTACQTLTNGGLYVYRN